MAIGLIQKPQEPQIVQNEVIKEPDIEEEQPSKEENIAITCFICRGNKHYAIDCQKYK